MEKKLEIQPLFNFVFIEKDEEKSVSNGGIIIPDNAKEKPQRGRVVSVGKGKVREDGTVQPLDLKEGDTILFGKYAGTEVKIEGDEYLIMREDDVLGVLVG